MSQIKNMVRQFKLKGFLAPFILFLFLIFSLIDGIGLRDLWLVAENCDVRNGEYSLILRTERMSVNLCGRLQNGK